MVRGHMLSPMSFARMPFDPESYLTDVRMFEQEGFGAVYLIDDEQKALVETGTSWDASKILEAVKTFGLKPSDIDALIVSHIHLDHAGGAGFLLSDMPRAKVYVHERGFKHLVDPSKLVASAHQALNDDEVDPSRHLLDLKPRALLFSHYGPHGKPRAAIESMMALYPSWARIVKERLASVGEDVVLRELYEMSCRAAKRFPRDFLERRIRVSIRGIAAYHARMEHAGPGR